MVDGVVDIPIGGTVVAPGAAVDAAPRGGHFFAGPENCLAEVAICSVLEQPAAGYNPLVFYGPSGTGKSHLAQGLARAWKSQARSWRPKGDTLLFADAKMGTASRQVVSTTAVDFARELAEAIETQAVDEFRARHRGASLWVLEDLGQLATRRSGKLSAQEELIHTLDTLVGADRWAVITCSALPADLPGILPALQSRLMSGLTVPMSPPGPEARLAIIQQLAAAAELPLPEPVARILADGLEGTARELTGAILELMAAVEAGPAGPRRAADPGRAIDRQDAASAGELSDRPREKNRGCQRSLSRLRGMLDADCARHFVAQRNRGRYPTLHEIALATAKHFSLRLADLRSPVRRRALVTARGVAVYLARHHAGATLDDIGRYFGSRHHTTIIHSCQKTEELLKSDLTIRDAVEHLHQMLWKT